MGFAARIETSGRPFLGLLFLALLIRAAIPAGMMLAPGQIGLPRIVPCWGAAPAATRPHHGDGHLPPADGQPSPPLCPFGVLLIPAVAPAPPLLAAAPAPAPAPAAPRPVWRVPHLDFAALRPPATGPPAFL